MSNQESKEAKASEKAPTAQLSVDEQIKLAELEAKQLELQIKRQQLEAIQLEQVERDVISASFFKPHRSRQSSKFHLLYLFIYFKFQLQ